MTAPGLIFGTRLIRTTPVKTLSFDGEIVDFTTENSTYSLIILGELDDDEQPKQPEAKEAA